MGRYFIILIFSLIAFGSENSRATESSDYYRKCYTEKNANACLRLAFLNPSDMELSIIRACRFGNKSACILEKQDLTAIVSACTKDKSDEACVAMILKLDNPELQNGAATTLGEASIRIREGLNKKCISSKDGYFCSLASLISKHETSAQLGLIVKACEFGLGSACATLAVEAYESGNSSVGKQLAKRGCDLEFENACIVEASNLKKSGNTSGYFGALNKLCSGKNSVACFLLGIEYQEAGKASLATEKYATSCRLGMAKACWHHATQIDKSKAGDAINAATLGCNQREPYSCSFLAHTYKELGNVSKANSYYDLGCKYGDGASCTALGLAALSNGKKRDGLVLLKKGRDYLERDCKEGNENSCGLTRKLASLGIAN